MKDYYWLQDSGNKYNIFENTQRPSSFLSKNMMALKNAGLLPLTNPFA
jgi:hypothetical protein